MPNIFKFLVFIRLTVYNYSDRTYRKGNKDVRVYFCPGSGEKMGHFRKTSTEAMRRKPYTGCSKIQPLVADTKGRGEASG